MNVDDNPRFLPEEIITNILKSLPVKSLIRFQCVCKHWRNLIKTPSFIQNHLTHQNPSLLIQHSQAPPSGFPRYLDPLDLCLLDCEMQFHDFKNPPIIDSSVDFHIVGSCDGLICVVNYNTRPHTLLLWNPATREIRQMPASTYCVLPSYWRFGFGFSPFVNDYKIVRATLHNMEMYSLRTGSWKDIGFDNIEDFIIYSGGLTINGVMFWHGLRIGLDGNEMIISFDLATEVFTMMPLPALVNHVDEDVKLAVYEDKLALIYLPSMMNPQCACIYFWVMEEGVGGSSEERWSFKRTYVHNPVPVKLRAGTIWRNQFVYIDHELPRIIGETEVEMEDVEPNWGIHLINFTTNEHKQFAIPERRYGFSAYRYGFSAYRITSVYNYVESLLQIGNIQH